ncbi:MAG: DUF4147 domain-containing protein, partial [Planctomycetota bacterium]
DLTETSDSLMRAGATIDELNTVRKHLDTTKGGGLGLACRGRRARIGVVSDVIGDRLDIVSSGPFFGDRSTFAEATGVLDRYGVGNAPARAAIAAGAAGDRPENPRPNDPRLQPLRHEVLASNRTAVQAAADALRQEGIDRPLVRFDQQGEARGWGERLAADLRSGAEAVVLGGESVVSGITGDASGGPVQEAVLAAGLALRDLGGWLVVGLATDGIDGPTDAAGAALDAERLDRVPDAAGLLARHDSYRALERAGALVRKGPTGTNVNDVLVGLCLPGGIAR